MWSDVRTMPNTVPSSWIEWAESVVADAECRMPLIADVPGIRDIVEGHATLIAGGTSPEKLVMGIREFTQEGIRFVAESSIDAFSRMLSSCRSGARRWGPVAVPAWRLCEDPAAWMYPAFAEVVVGVGPDGNPRVVAESGRKVVSCLSTIAVSLEHGEINLHGGHVLSLPMAGGARLVMTPATQEIDTRTRVPLCLSYDRAGTPLSPVWKAAYRSAARRNVPGFPVLVHERAPIVFGADRKGQST
jgi:hypothetical protein